MNFYALLLPMLLVVSISAAPTIILLVVAWKIMRAQEAMAQALLEMANRSRPQS